MSSCQGTVLAVEPRLRAVSHYLPFLIAQYLFSGFVVVSMPSLSFVFTVLDKYQLESFYFDENCGVTRDKDHNIVAAGMYNLGQFLGLVLGGALGKIELICYFCRLPYQSFS